MRTFDIKNPKKYQSNGEEKTFYANVGVIRINDKGTIFVEMNDKEVSYVAFEREEKKNPQVNNSGPADSMRNGMGDNFSVPGEYANGQ